MSITIPDALTPALNSKYPHRPRIQFILRRHPEATREAFEQALGNWRRAREFNVQFGSIIARAGAAIPEEQAFISGFFRGLAVSPLDGYISLDIESYEPSAADFATLLKAAEGCLDSLAEVIDPSESVAYAGVANLVIPGVAPLSLILILDRAKGLSVAQYNEWWAHHADDHRRLNPAQVGYHQLHSAPELNAAAAKAAGVATPERCVFDFMCIAQPADAFPVNSDRTEEEARALSADIGAHVSFAAVSGSFMREL